MFRKTLLGSAVLFPLAGCFSPDALETTETEQGESEMGTSGTGTSASGPTNSTTGAVTLTGSGSGEATSSTPTGPGSSSGEPGSETGSETGGVPATCGNGEPDDGETCDDGNEVNGDGCNNDCVESGSVVWTATFDDGNDTATSLAIDPDDNILAVALVGGVFSGTFSNWQRLYSPDGEAVATSTPGLDFSSVDIDETGNYVGVFFQSSGQLALGWNIGVGEVEPDGSLVWSSILATNRIPGRASAFPLGGVAFGGGIRTGVSYNYGHASFVAAYDASGSEDWQDAPFPENSACTGVATGPEGTVAALCYENYGATIYLRRYLAAGNLQWERELDTTSTSWGNAYVEPDPRDLFVPAIDQNEDGRTAVALSSPLGPAVLMLDQNGTEVFSTVVTGSGDLTTRDLAVLADGSVVLVGSDSNPSDSNDLQIMVHRIAADGTPLWTDLVAGESGGDDRAKEVELDSRGDIVVFGSTQEGPGDRDLWLRKYTP